MNYRNQIFIGDALEQLRNIPDGVVQTCVTSPPYYNLRNYEVEGQIGLEITPYEYIDKLIAVFRGVHRILRDDGTLWINLGDSYCSMGLGKGMKPKDLMGIPFRVAFALQNDGWWLRSDIVWHKTFGMPESVKDRPTRNHEYIFLLTKSQDYFYDNDAIKEPHAYNRWSERKVENAKILDAQYKGQAGKSSLLRKGENLNFYPEGGKNKRTVWTITPKPYLGAHFAVFPPEIPEICIKAGTSEKGACEVCGAPWLREIEDFERPYTSKVCPKHTQSKVSGLHNPGWRELEISTKKMIGWQPSCSCNHNSVVPCLVLDPFAGSGTTLQVATELRRDYIGIELNPEYLKLIKERVAPAEEKRHQRELYDMMEELPQESD